MSDADAVLHDAMATITYLQARCANLAIDNARLRAELEKRPIVLKPEDGNAGSDSK